MVDLMIALYHKNLVFTVNSDDNTILVDEFTIARTNTGKYSIKRGVERMALYNEAETVAEYFG